MNLPNLHQLLDRALPRLLEVADEPEPACLEHARRCSPRIIRHNDGQPYLTRWYLIGAPLTPDPFDQQGAPKRGVRWPKINHGLYLHRFQASDLDRFHNHPWGAAVSHILHGSYLEHRPDGSRTVQPGERISLTRDTYHRVELHDGPVWTLFAVGQFVGDWGYTASSEADMAKVKGAHHKGTYQARAKALTTAANADPSTRCWRCGLTLAQHRRHRNGTPAHWTAGHVNAGEPGGQLLPEASVCNYSHGARLGNMTRKAPPARRSRRW